MMNAIDGRCKLNVYGDFFMKQLCPELRRHPGFEVQLEMTMRKGTIKKLHNTLLNSPEMNNLKYPYSTALMMIGTQDVRDFAYVNIKSYLKKMKRRLKFLLDFLKVNHRNVIILTALPVNEMEYHFHKLLLLKKYNKYIRGLTEKGLEVIDVFSDFITKSRYKNLKFEFSENRRARGKQNDKWNNYGNQMVMDKILKAESKYYFERETCPGENQIIFRKLDELFKCFREKSFVTMIRGMDAEDSPWKLIKLQSRWKCIFAKLDLGNFVKSFVKFNGFTHSTYLTSKIALVNVQQLKSSNVKKKIEKEEKCSDRSIMTSRVEDMCPTDSHQTHQCTSINYFTGNGKNVGEGNADISNVRREMCFSQHSEDHESEESIYKTRTKYLMEEIKQKLRRLRITEYTKYGEALIKTDNLKSKKKELVTVASYNILSQELLEKHNYLYANHDHRSLRWGLRREILLEELYLLDADILCLQEVDCFILDPVYNERLSHRGYRGVYKKKTLGQFDGCAIYFKNDKFNLVESCNVELFRPSAKLLAKGNVGIVLKLGFKDRPEAELVVATTHLLYNPKRSDIRLAQTQIMLAEIERIAYKRWDHVKARPEYLPIIFTGDMNYTPQSGVYELVTKSSFKYEGKPNKFLIPHTDGYLLQKTLIPSDVGVTDSCQYLSSLSEREGETEIKFESGCLEHPLYLSSVYNHSKKDLPEATTNQYEWLTVDYIYYSQLFNPEANERNEGGLKLVSKLTLPNTREAEIELENIPNLGCGSDHLPLLATFHLSNS